MLKAIIASTLAGIWLRLARSGDPGVSMHPADWLDDAGRSAPRRYRSVGHAIHHQKELIALTPALARVYVLHALPPALREKIMIMTALSNDCPP